ncbi:MAG TPA: hypothetical protein VJO35_02840 [Terriglobales bacterium]|nr:hypothetical protein [Terriglobales bacterium]
MKIDLANIRAKLSRSQEHAQTIYGEIKAWIDREPYSLTKQVNPDCTRYSLVLRENEPAPFKRWTLIFSDALNNLRSALDYLVYEVAVIDTCTIPPAFERKLMFPLTDSDADFDEAVRKRRVLGDISDPVRAVFKSLQPYHRPHPTLPPLLYILRELNNTDKHRLLNLAYGAITQGNLGLVGHHPPDGRKCQTLVAFGEIKDGTEVAANVFDRPTPNMEWDRTEMEIVVAVWHGKRDASAPEFTAYTELSGLLRLLISEVRTVIHTFLKDA